jgi:hypothetical protein
MENGMVEEVEDLDKLIKERMEKIPIAKCEYCGKHMPIFLVDDDGAKRSLMFSQSVPHERDSPLLKGLFKTRQIWICRSCYEEIG